MLDWKIQVFVFRLFYCYLKKSTSSKGPSSSGMAERWAHLYFVCSSIHLFMWKIKNYKWKILLGHLICSSSAIIQKLDTGQTCESHLSRFVPPEGIHQVWQASVHVRAHADVFFCACNTTSTRIFILRAKWGSGSGVGGKVRGEVCHPVCESPHKVLWKYLCSCVCWM